MKVKAKKVVVRVQAEYENGQSSDLELTFLEPKSFTMSQHVGFDRVDDTKTKKTQYVRNGKGSFELKVEK